jgi:hypothetical protein
VSQTSGCRAVREATAVALLRGEPLPADAVAHHAGCPGCRLDHERIAVLPTLLAAIADDEVPPVEVPDNALLRRLLGELAARRRRRRLVVAAVAAAAAVLLAVPIGSWLGGRTSGTVVQPPSTSVRTPDAEGTLVAEGSIHDEATNAGANVQVLARGAGRGSIVVISPWGLRSGVHCRIDLVDAHGAPQPIEEWTVPEGYRTGWTYRGEVSLPPRELAAVRFVDTGTGRVLLDVPVAAV